MTSCDSLVDDLWARVGALKSDSFRATSGRLIRAKSSSTCFYVNETLEMLPGKFEFNLNFYFHVSRSKLLREKGNCKLLHRKK